MPRYERRNRFRVNARMADRQADYGRRSCDLAKGIGGDCGELCRGGGTA
jgi:hypothetical protein